MQVIKESKCYMEVLIIPETVIIAYKFMVKKYRFVGLENQIAVLRFPYPKLTNVSLED